MSERAHELLAEAKKALDLRRRLAERGEATAELDELLDGLYRDLGRTIVASDPGSLLLPDPPTSARERFTSEVPDEDKGSGWYTDDRSGSVATGPIFDSGDLGDIEFTEVPDAEDLRLPPEDDTEGTDGTDEDHHYAVDTLEVARRRVAHSGTGLHAFRDGTAPFTGALNELLDLLRSPFDLDDPTELGIEASRVQWATTDLETRLRPYPDDVKTAVLGLLSARAQFLRSRLEVDVGARLALDRLRRYRMDRMLPSVPGLLPTPLPELGSWLEDAEGWWAVLRPARAT